jgi:putative heme-binding domain-containing protein
MAEVGPDGNVWIIDWYNYIVQHNPTPVGFETGRGNAYETDLRDKVHGRVYRLVHESAEPPSPISLRDAAPEQCVAMLKNDNLLWRRHAQRLIVERGATDVVPSLIALANDPSVDAIGLNTAAIHALWTLQGLGVLDGSRHDALAAAVGALRHSSAGVRRNAVQVLPESPASVREIIATGLLQDRDAQVRLAAFLALADQPPTEDAARAIATAIVQPINSNDRWIPEAATAAAARNAESFLRSMTNSPVVPVSVSELLRIVAEHYARSEPGDAAAPLLASFAGADRSVVRPVIAGLGAGWPADRELELADETVTQLETLLQRLEPAERGQLVRLVSRWGSAQFQKYATETVEQLLAHLDDASRTTDQRLLTARELLAFQPTNAQLAAELINRVTPQLEPDLACGLIDALGQCESDEVGQLVTEKFASLTPTERAAAVAVLLSRRTWTETLLAAMDTGAIQLNELSLDQRQSLANYPDRSIRFAARRLLTRGGALPNADRQKVLESLATLAHEQGDPAAGKAVFTKVCAKCHMHSGEGSAIGPDLTGMAVHPKHELLLQIIDPNRSVESNFRTYTVVTNQGLVLSGMLASESRTAIELFNAEGEKKTVLREDIDELIASTKSLMPEGFEKQITETELRDLLEFMTQRGRYVPVDLTKAATAASDRGMFNSIDNRAERLVFENWGLQSFAGVPFNVIDPRDGRVANVLLLHSPNGEVTRRMPRTVTVPANGPAKLIHLLSGVSGWGFPYSPKGTESLIVRIQYDDDETEEHRLINGEHFADYIRVVDVPQSQLAFRLRGQQIRYLAIEPQRREPIKAIEFAKGDDRTAPVIMAVTLESP